MSRFRLEVLASHPISLAGVVLVTVSTVLFLVLVALEAMGFFGTPYLGLVIYVAVPAAFMLGLPLIPLGVWLQGRRRRSGRAEEPAWPVIDLGQASTRRTVALVLVLTVVNVAIVSMAGYGGLHYMEQAEFCGQVCHTPMEPQFTAYQDAPHSRVACVSCHVGSGAQALVESKINGTRQLWQVATNNVPKPIPSPVHSLRPARDTCEQCHWPEKYHGDRTRVIREYGEDAANTESTTTLIVHVGGGSHRLGRADGIHWHMNLENEIEYVATDASRGEIPYVRLRDRNGAVTEYAVAGATAESVANGERRRMDCMDCHNRPAHTFVATPQRAVDGALANGRLPRALPFARREAVAAVTADYASQDAARTEIARRLRAFYAGAEGGGPDAKLVDQAVTATQDVYLRNVFPSMNVTWGTYPNHLGHVDSPGCFRCHDDNHTSRDGRVIRQDCELCHAMP